jgi:hypothetical protein
LLTVFLPEDTKLPKERPLGTIVTFNSGEACSTNHEISMSCFVISNSSFSEGLIALFFFSRPPIILSTASRKSCFVTEVWLFLAAINAASLQTFAISAPLNQGFVLPRILCLHYHQV